MKTNTMMKVLGKGVLAALVGLVLGVACSDDGDGDSAGGACDESKQGFTTCMLSTCQPGQYCDSGAFCMNGCLSDVNCSCNQVCEKQPGQMLGACTLKPQSGGTSAGGTGNDPTDTGFDPTDTGLPPTGGSEPWPEMCVDNCDGLNVFMCFQPGGLQACYDRCAEVTEAQLKQFESCITGAVGDCTKLLACQDNLPS